MDLYEQNYIYLRKLIPHINDIDSKAVSAKRNSVDLHLQVIEREKYTTTVLLTHYFKVANKTVSKPELIVRVYNDARNAEALSAHLHGHQIKLAQSKVDVKERYYLNRFLNKWLRYLLKQGHVLRAPVSLSTPIK